MQNFHGLDASAAKHIFNTIDDDRLTEMLIKVKQDIPDDAAKKQIVQLALSAAEGYGIKELFQAVGKIDVEDYCNAFDIPTRDEQPTTKNYLTKKLVEKVQEDGLAKALKGADEGHVSAILELLDITKKKDVKGYFEDIVREMGVQLFLGKMTAELLNAVCSDLKIRFESQSVTQLVTAIIAGKAPEKREAPKLSPKKPSKTKPVLKKGVKAVDVYQHYLKGELQDYCRENDLKVSGTSKELIDRIIEHLESDGKENTNANKPNTATRRPHAARIQVTKEVTSKKGKKEEKEQEAEEETAADTSVEVGNEEKEPVVADKKKKKGKGKK